MLQRADLRWYLSLAAAALLTVGGLRACAVVNARSDYQAALVDYEQQKKAYDEAQRTDKHIDGARYRSTWSMLRGKWRLRAGEPTPPKQPDAVPLASPLVWFTLAVLAWGAVGALSDESMRAGLGAFARQRRNATEAWILGAKDEAEKARRIVLLITIAGLVLALAAAGLGYRQLATWILIAGGALIVFILLSDSPQVRKAERDQELQTLRHKVEKAGEEKTLAETVAAAKVARAKGEADAKRFKPKAPVDPRAAELAAAAQKAARQDVRNEGRRKLEEHRAAALQNSIAAGFGPDSDEYQREDASWQRLILEEMKR